MLSSLAICLNLSICADTIYIWYSLNDNCIITFTYSLSPGLINELLLFAIYRPCPNQLISQKIADLTPQISTSQSTLISALCLLINWPLKRRPTLKNAWRSYFDQSPDVWLKFLIPGDNTKNSIKSIDSLAHAKLQSSKQSMIHAHMLIEVKHYTKIHLDVDKLRAYMESTMGNHIHIDNKLPAGKDGLDCIKAYILKEEQV